MAVCVVEAALSFVQLAARALKLYQLSYLVLNAAFCLSVAQ